MPDPNDENKLSWTDRIIRVYKPGGGEPEVVSVNSMLSPSWDARPLESDSWGNILGFDDGLGGGNFIDMRLWLRAMPGTVNEPPMYCPAHVPPPPFFKSGGVRRCYQPTAEDTATERALYPAHRNPHAPPWQCIEADLIVAGHDRDKLVDLNPPALLRLLLEAREQHVLPADAVSQGDKPDERGYVASPADPADESKTLPDDTVAAVFPNSHAAAEFGTGSPTGNAVACWR